jgi:hypothetical protein
MTLARELMTLAGQVKRTMFSMMLTGECFRNCWPRQAAHRYSVYLLYWYKSTNTDAKLRTAPLCDAAQRVSCRLRYSVYLLYWYKSTNTDAAQPPAGNLSASSCRWFMCQESQAARAAAKLLCDAGHFS